MKPKNNHDTAQHGYSTWEYESIVAVDSSTGLGKHRSASSWGLQVSKKQGVVVPNNINKDRCDSSHTADLPKKWNNKREKPTTLLKVFVLGLSLDFLVWQREATYLLHLVPPYRVRGGETEEVEGGGRGEGRGNGEGAGGAVGVWKESGWGGGGVGEEAGGNSGAALVDRRVRWDGSPAPPSPPLRWMMLGDGYCNTQLESRVYWPRPPAAPPATPPSNPDRCWCMVEKVLPSRDL